MWNFNRFKYINKFKSKEMEEVMYSLIQVYMIMLLIGLYALVGAIPLMILMAIVTYRKKDKAYFRKKIDKFIKG